jgi:hypothetical protein
MHLLHCSSKKEHRNCGFLRRHGRILPGSRDSADSRSNLRRRRPDSPHVAVSASRLRATAGQNRIRSATRLSLETWTTLRLLTIVGIRRHPRIWHLDAPASTVYVNLFQRPRPAISLAMLSDADTAWLHPQHVNSCRAQPRDSGEVPDVFAVYSASLGSRKFNVILIGFSSGPPRYCWQRQGFLA